MIPAKCCTNRAVSKIKLSDKHSTSTVFLNPTRDAYTVVRFDGCVICGKTACDWLIEKPGVGRIAVELKGSDIDHAATQIEAAFQYLKQCGLPSLPLAGLIICTRYPSVDTKFQLIKRRVKSNYNAKMHVKSKSAEVDLVSLL